MYEGYNIITEQHPSLTEYCKSIKNSTKGRITLQRVTLENHIFEWCGKISRVIPPGDYIMLYVGQSVMMSDTPAEIDDMYAIYKRIKSKNCKKILIAGLGLGIVSKLISMIDCVKKITVVEYNSTIVDLVSPYLKSEIESGKIEIVQSDIHEFTPKIKYNAVWLDIWGTISSDNKKEMIKLKEKFKPHTTSNGPILCWSEKLIKYSDN